MSDTEFDTGGQDEPDKYPDPLRAWIDDLKAQRREKSPAFDRQFVVRAVIESRIRKKAAGNLPGDLMRHLPRRNVVVYGHTGIEDRQFPAMVRLANELAAWIGGGEGITHIRHEELKKVAQNSIRREAGNARRRKRIDIVS